MSWVAMDKNGEEYIYAREPSRSGFEWWALNGIIIDLPSGSIQKLIGRTMTWDDEPVELKEVEK